MPEATLEDIWIHIYEKGEVRSKDLEKQFVETKKLSYGTMYKYKGILEREGKIKAKRVPPDRHHGPYTVFYVPKEFHEICEVLKNRQKIESILDDLPLKEQTETFDLWFEIEMVVNEMSKMGYPPKEIRSMIKASLEELHSSLVARIVEDEEK